MASSGTTFALQRPIHHGDTEFSESVRLASIAQGDCSETFFRRPFMSIDIEAVLALLPELFPGTPEIPMERVRSNPDNPGPAADDEEIAELAANIAEVGLRNAIKVKPDKDNPLIPGVSPH